MDNFLTKLRQQTRGLIDNRSFNGTASRGSSPTASSPQKHNPFGLSSQTPRNPPSKRNKIILVVDTPETDWYVYVFEFYICRDIRGCMPRHVYLHVRVYIEDYITAISTRFLKNNVFLLTLSSE